MHSDGVEPMTYYECAGCGRLKTSDEKPSIPCVVCENDNWERYDGGGHGTNGVSPDMVWRECSECEKPYTLADTETGACPRCGSGAVF